MSTPQAAIPSIDIKRRCGELAPLPASDRATREIRATRLRALSTQDIPIPLIHFFPDNHNEQDERTFQGECESLLRFGMVDPCLLRPFDAEDLAAGIGIEGAFEMIDGEHRTRALVTWIEQGLPPEAHPDLVYLCEAQVIPCLVQPMSRRWAARLRVVLSETRGRANVVKLGRVLSQLVEQVGLDELRVGTPWSVEHVREIVEVGKFDWERFEREQAERKAGASEDASALIKLTLECPASRHGELVEQLRPLVHNFGLRLKTKK